MDADPPPAKRRRTSPRLSNRGSTEPAPDASTTATTPPDAPQTADTHTETDETRARPPSFASPTRASLARHNPAILHRRQSVSRNENENGDGHGNGTGSTEGDNAQPSVEAVEAMIDEQLGQSSAEKEHDVRPLARPPVRSPVRSPSRQLSTTRPLAQPPLRSPARLSRSRSRSRSPTRRLFGADNATLRDGAGNGSGGALFGAAPQKSPEAVSAARHRPADGLPGGVVGSVPGSLLGAPPRRSPMKPVPRPLPPPDPQRGEDLLEPLIARDKQRSGLDQLRSYEEVPPEPELPPTPDHVDKEALTRSPPGIHHSSTPSKRPKRAARARAANAAAAAGAGGVQKTKPGTVQTSSPLKQPPVKAADTATTGTTTQTEADGGDAALQEASGNDPTTTEKTAKRGRGRPRKSEPARNVQPADPDEHKKRERDALQAEIAGLEADLALAAAANERMRSAVENGGQSADGDNAAALISLLRRHVLPDDEAGNDGTKDASARASMQTTMDWLQAAANPIAFLPFGKPRADVTDLVPFAAPPDNNSTGDETQPLPPSHHPIEMTAAEELPFLQAFTPLAFRSEIVIVPAADAGSDDTTPLQKHIITASSTTPPGLFLAHIEMTVHAKSLRITDLQVPRMAPPAAAAELAPLLARITTGQDDGGASTNGSSALTRNVTVLTWAMGEWVRVAVRRAKFWAVLARKLREKGDGGGGMAGMAEDIRQTRAQQRKKRRRKAGSDDGDVDGDDDGPNRHGAAPVSPTELLEHLGRTAMDMDVDVQDNGATASSSSPSLRVEWSIQFDWTGEATSHIGLLVGVPGKWRKADKRGRLAQLPKLFDQLVQDSGDPMDAVQTVVALLAGDV
ncbi:hypothetical protein SPBR_04096 [Sporothrix brasiliensis 5110]|uniref:Uncharacterized protein n=1 Tax=Sporothrix brasiliensis 5110 TaxID=1398154 RepID=A0A0C2J3T9_9PEZI|nr:uncharacterized protein SPBR_04096 [Sporothrix brasiliensis 5110]KIH93645.1 hypothetical protein SPBR_04096 [Sporothrix brasiliensis 5110]